MTNRVPCLTDFKSQLSKLYDAFKHLSQEEQTEALNLIRDLYTSSFHHYFIGAASGDREENFHDEKNKKVDLQVQLLDNSHFFPLKTLKSNGNLKLNFKINSDVKQNMLEHPNKINPSVKNEDSLGGKYYEVEAFPLLNSEEMNKPTSTEKQLCENFNVESISSVNPEITGKEMCIDGCVQPSALEDSTFNNKQDASKKEFVSNNNKELLNDKNNVSWIKKKFPKQINGTIKTRKNFKQRLKPSKVRTLSSSDNRISDDTLDIKLSDNTIDIKLSDDTIDIKLSDEASDNICRLLLCCRFCRNGFKTVEDFNIHRCDSINSDLLFKCKFCSVIFSHKHHLERHLKGHKRNNCRICNAQFTKRKALCKHLKVDHDISEPEKLYECSFCEKSFSKRPSLNAHLKNHANGRLLCTKCGFMCGNESAYNDHMKEHLINSKYECLLCGKKFVRRQQHDQHMMGHEKHSCSACNVTFSTKKLLLKHQQSIHGAHIVEKKHECPTCNKLFLRPKHLQIHQRIHTGEKPVKCSHCEKSFCNERALSKHMKTVRHLQKVNVGEGKVVEIEKPFLCAECGARFYRQQSLLRHIEVIHSASESFKCPHCEYSTKCKTNLKRHSELHTNNKRFICEICGASFRALATLKEHHAYVHSDSRTFICEICNKGFKSKSSLQRHLRIHSEVRPYKCHCNRDYKRMSHLKRHMVSAHRMTFKRNNLVKPAETSDTDTNANNQDTSSDLVRTLEALQDHSSCDDFSLLGASDHSFVSNKMGDTIVNESLTEDHLSKNSNEGSDYASVPSRNMQVFLEKNLHIMPESNSKNTLMSLISHPNVKSAEVCLQSDAHVTNSISLTDSNLNLSPNSFCNFNLSSSPLHSINMENISTNLQPQNNSHDVLSLTSQDSLIRPHSLPNLNFQNQTSIDSFTHFSLHNADSPTSMSIPSFLLNADMPSSPQVSELTLDHNSSSKQLFGESDDILTLPPYTSNHLNAGNCPTEHLFNQSRTDMWDTSDSNRLKISDSEIITTSTCPNIVSSSFPNNLPSNANNLLSHNLIFPNDSLMACPIDTSSLNSEFDSLSNLC